MLDTSSPLCTGSLPLALAHTHGHPVTPHICHQLHSTNPPPAAFPHLPPPPPPPPPPPFTSLLHLLTHLQTHSTRRLSNSEFYLAPHHAENRAHSVLFYYNFVLGTQQGVQHTLTETYHAQSINVSRRSTIEHTHPVQGYASTSALSHVLAYPHAHTHSLMNSASLDRYAKVATFSVIPRDAVLRNRYHSRAPDTARSIIFPIIKTK